MITVQPDQVVHFTASDGVRLGCHVGGQGSPVLLVHGTSADHSRWKPVLPALQKRFTTYALDRRGRGASGDAAEWSLDREVEDIVTVVEGIGGPVDVVGHSMGATLSMLAATQTSAIRRLVLYEPGGIMPERFRDREPLNRLRELLAAGDRDALVQAFMRTIVRMPEEQIQLIRSLPAWQGRVGAAHTLVRELESASSYRLDPASVRRISVPTLLLEGGDSPEFRKADVGLVHQTIAGSRVVVMPGQQHVAMDTGTQLFLDAVLGFLT